MTKFSGRSNPLLSAQLVALLSFAACGGGDDAVPDDGQGEGDGDDPGDVGLCSVRPSFGDLGALAGEAARSSEFFGMQLVIEAGPPTDTLTVSLWEGFGVFAEGVTVGDFELTGNEIDPELCGACVGVFADVSTTLEGGLTAEVLYMPTGGTMHVTSIDGTLSGSLENVTLDAISLQGNPVEGCTTAIDSVSFAGRIIVVQDDLGG